MKELKGRRAGVVDGNVDKYDNDTWGATLYVLV